VTDLRPVQLGEGEYGKQTAFYKVDFTDGQFKEEQISIIDNSDIIVDNKKGVDKIHTYSKVGEYETIDFVKFVINETIRHEDDYVVDVVRSFFEHKWDLDDCEYGVLDFQDHGKWYSVELVDGRMQLDDMPEHYSYWKFHSDNEELVELRWSW